MFNELIGKNVIVNMLASTYVGEGMAPCSYFGTMLEVGEKFVKVDVKESGLTFDTVKSGLAGFGSSMLTKREDVNKIMYFNINLISYIKVED